MGRKIKDNKVNTDKLKGPMISSKLLLLVSLIYIGLPIILFLVNWFDWYIGIPAAALLLFALYGFWKGFEDDSFYVSLIDLLAASVICFIFLIFCGQGGLFLQSWDNHTKNAIFRDLIELAWPVVYEETGNVLVYYFMYWLVPALAGKLGGWELANRFLLCFTTLGVMLAMLWTLRSVGGGKRRRPYLTMIALVFLFWSGMNYIGNIFSVRFGLTDYSLIFSSNEGWLDGQINGYDSSYLYRSIYDSLQQSYNYAIPAWLVTSMLLNLKDIRCFALLGCLCLPYAPIPFVGMLPLFLAKAFPELFESIKKHETGKNLLASSQPPSFPAKAGRSQKHEPYFWVSLVELLVIPLIVIIDSNFAMRGSIPALFLAMYFVMNHLIQTNWKKSKEKLLSGLLIVCICVGMVTPFTEIYRTVSFTLSGGYLLQEDVYSFGRIWTMDEQRIRTLRDQFFVYDYEDKFFFKYLAKN